MRLRARRTKCGAVKPYHMRMHAFGINRVAAELARHITDGVCNRLLQQSFAPWFSITTGFMPPLSGLRCFSTVRSHVTSFLALRSVWFQSA